MKNLRINIQLIIFLLSICASLASCHKEKEEETLIAEKNKTVLLFTRQTDLGDIFYYDKILEGLAKACLTTGIDYYVWDIPDFSWSMDMDDYDPDDDDDDLSKDGKMSMEKYIFEKENITETTFMCEEPAINIVYYLKLYMQLMGDMKFFESIKNDMMELDDEHILIIFTEPLFYYALLDNPIMNNPKIDVLLLDSHRSNDQFYTMDFPMGGVSYLAGVQAADLADKMDLVNIETMMSSPFPKGEYEAFCKGLQDYAPDMRSNIDTSIYDNKSGAYDFYRKHGTEHQIFFPVGINSLSGLLRAANETNLDESYIIGPGADISGYNRNVPFSIVKDVDRAVYDFVINWLEEKPMPKHHCLGLESGYLNLVWSPNGIVNEKSFNDINKKYMNKAISMEK